MFNYIVRRLIYMIPTLIGITLVTFMIVNLAPGEPAALDAQKMNPNISAEDIEKLRKLYGLDKPVIQRYFDWMKKILTLDFGYSFKDNRKVLDKIKERLPKTITLNVVSLIVIFAIGVPLGVAAARWRNTLFDKITTILVFMGYSLPGFWIALLLILVFGVKLGILPISGYQSLGADSLPFWDRWIDRLKHLIMPVIVFATGGIASISRYMKMSLLDVINQDYIRTARAKGLPEWKVVYWHALRNALIPIVTMFGFMLPGLIGGSFIIETIFAYPGMGRLGYDAIMTRDYPVIMANSFIVAVLTLIGNLLADLMYGLVDPRIRYD